MSSLQRPATISSQSLIPQTLMVTPTGNILRRTPYPVPLNYRHCGLFSQNNNGH
ncbi:hypothetical protein BJX99DRAFT_242543 [Aspergillus californicus]